MPCCASYIYYNFFIPSLVRHQLNCFKLNQKKFFSQMRFMEPFLFLSSWFPHYTPYIMQFISKFIDVFPAYSRVDKSYSVLVPSTYFPQHLRTEFSVEMSHCGRVMQLLRDMVLKDQLPVNLFTKVNHNL